MNRIPVIFDCDTGLDDSLSLFMAVNDPRIKTLAVTTTFGNTVIENASKNTLNALAMLGRSDIPVAAGAKSGWKKPLMTSPQIHGVSGIGNYVYPEDHTGSFTGEPAWDLTYDLMMRSQKKVVYFALGPCTNIATTIRKYPDVKDKIDKVIFMGGAVREAAGSQCASVNVYHDPEACRYVINSGVPFHMCTHQMTDRVRIDRRQIDENFMEGHEICRTAWHFLCDYYDNCNRFGENDNNSLALHDPATVLYLLEPECFSATKFFCDVEVHGEYTYGFTLIDIHNIYRKKPSEFNIDFITVKDGCEEYLTRKFIDGIKNASKER